ncbi:MULTISPECIES: type II secretion system F family protein [Cysteiniphilum]|uniref:Type II secretion system protein F n=1 Tax=Cysteiniphilum litorale TaxID=2056700 RepID=A0A8J3E869_9GAMM|nr:MULTISPECIES: type II secretion system F family protein [Cysteiniphilum]GGF92695.1 type II secretion system protein F [Cysteiniphilum litorale]
MSMAFHITSVFKPAQDRFGNQLHIFPKLQVKWLASQFTSTKRMKLYKSLKMLLSSGMSMNMALERMSYNFKKCGRKLFNPDALLISILDDVNFRYSKLGMSFFDAIRPYIPKSEMSILSSDSYEIANGLENVVKHADKQGALIRAILISMTKPAMFILAMVGMMYFSAMKLMPSLNASIPKDKMPAITLKFSHFNQWMVDHVFIISVILIVLIVGIVVIIPQQKNKVRRILDYLPPFSIYKKISTVKFLVSLSLLLSSHNKDSKDKHNVQASLHFSLLSIRNNANGYIASYVNAMLSFLDQGTAPGETLMNTGFFDRNISALIGVYSDAGKLGEGIYDLAVNYFDEQINQIKRSFKVISGVFFLAMGSYLAFFVIALQALGTISA